MNESGNVGFEIGKAGNISCANSISDARTKRVGAVDDKRSLLHAKDVTEHSAAQRYVTAQMWSLAGHTNEMDPDAQ